MEHNLYQFVKQLYVEAIGNIKSQIYNACLAIPLKLPHQLGSRYKRRKTLPQGQQRDESQHCR